MKRLMIMIVTLVMATTWGRAQTSVITSFQGNGALTWTNSMTNVAYQIEWASSVTGAWSRSWQTLNYVESHSNLAMTASVPMFYRVVMVTNPPPAGTVLIDVGIFAMGDNSSTPSGNQIPVHTIFLNPFYMDKYEVTKMVWDLVRNWALTNGYPDLTVGQGGSDTNNLPRGVDHPVVNVSWHDCVKWCNARSQKEGLIPSYYVDEAQTTVYRTGTNEIGNNCVKWDANGYRMPTEAEWEKAARGGLAGHHYPWPSYGGSYSNYIDGSKANYGGKQDGTTRVGYFNGSQTPSGVDMANGYGLYDMAGNAYEWCWDWYAHGYYSASPADNPHGPDAGLGRALRGWGWFHYLSDDFDMQCSRCYHRGYSDPTGQGTGTGFRCVRSH